MFSTSKFLVNPPSTVVTDPYFNYTTLLLNDTGTNGAQNNTFIDSSTNNFTITRNGNTTQGSFNPYMPTGYWGGYFDNASYLSVPSNAALTLGTGTYTIECWIYNSELVNSNTLFTWWTSGSNRRNVHIGQPYINYASQSTLFISALHGMVVGQWYHFALTYDGTTTRLFINGVVKGTYAGTQMFTTDAPFYIGAGDTIVGGSPFYGNLSNFRIIKGTCLYTANFTPPTTPLTAISGTALLCLQDNRFKDNSSNNFTITPTSTSKVTHFNPFAPPASYTTSAYGGSGYYDGSGDYLTAPNNTAFDFGSGNYTGEAWVYITSNTPSEQHIWGKRANSAIAYAPIIFGFSKSGTVYRIYFLGSFTGTSWGINSSFAKGTIDIPLNTWTHVAYVRNGTTFTSFVNGVQDLTFTGLSGSLMTNTDAQAIGASSTIGDTPFFGYISNMRVVKGTAVYTAAFTPPTAPVTAITNTSLLLNATNAGIYDATTLNDTETVGDAKVSTVQAKWGSSSMFFDGTGDWLLVPHNQDLMLGTGNFTVESWVYLSATGAATGIVGKGTSTTGWLLSTNSSNNVVFTYGSSTITSTGTLSGSTWYHVAVVRQGTGTNQTKIYINGINDGTGTVSTDFNQTNNMYVGADRAAGSALNGYLEDLRITKGIARYTANFTPPTAAFPTR